jgi:uncharacterized protein
MRVTVAWASPSAQDILPVEVPAGATVADCIEASRLAARYGIDIGTARVGVNGRLARADTVIAEGDRVEIYRRLAVDPKEARRARSRGPSVDKE